MKKLLLAILLVPVLANAQLQNYLTGSTPKTHRELQGSPTATTRLDTIIHSITIVLDSTMSSLQRYSLNAGNYSTIAAGLSDARTNHAPLLIPYDWTGGSPVLTTADSNVTIHDYRFGSYGFTGRRHWGFKSVWEADSLNRFAKLIDSVKTHGLLKLAEGTWSVPPDTLDTPYRIQGTVFKRTKPVDTSYNGTILQATNTNGTQATLTARDSGVWLEWLTFKGSANRTNGHGFLGTRQAVGDTIIRTTLGGYGVANSNAIFNGGDGFHFRGGDGLYLPNLDAYGNKGYGITFIGPGADGQNTAGATADGTTNLLLSGRTRANTKGGIQINNNAATIMIGNQSVHDTTWNVYINGKNRTTIINGDYEFAIPNPDTTIHSYMVPHVNEPVTANIYANKTRSLTMIGTFIGSDATEATYTADDLADSSYSTGSGTDATHIVSSQLLEDTDDYYKEWEVKNITLGGSYVQVTAFNAALNKLTLASSIVGQTVGQTFTIRRTPDYGVLVDSLESAVFINNALCSNCDSGKRIGVTSYANAIFIGADQNFNVLTDYQAINGADVNFVSLKLDRITTDGDFQIYGTTQYDFFTQDSFLLRSSSGMRQNSTGVLDLQYDSQQNVRTFFNVADAATREFRIYGDANTSTGLNKQYFALGWNTSTDNQFDIKNETGVDSVYVNFNSIVKFGGSTTAERYTSFLNRTGKPTAKNGEVQFYARGDSLFAQDDSGVERSLYVASGTGAPTSSPYITKTADATLSDEFALSTLATGLLRNTTTTGIPTSITTFPGLSTALTDFDLTGASAGNTIVRRSSGVWVDSTLGAGGGITVAQARYNSGWASNGTTAQDTSASTYLLDKQNIKFKVVDADNDSVMVIPQNLYPINYKDGATQLAAVDSLGTFYSATGYDAVGAAALTIGSADVTSITLTTDGTGNGEVVLPAQSVTGSEITNDSITPTQVDEAQNFTWTANQRFNHSAYFNADADTFKVDLRTALYPLELEIGNTRLFSVDSTGTADAVALTEGGNAVPSSSDNLSFFSTTSSTQLAAVLSDEVGTSGGFLRVDATGASAGNTVVRRASGVWVDSTLSTGISVASARANTGWTSDGTTARDTLASVYALYGKPLLSRRSQSTDIDTLRIDAANGKVIRYSDAGTILFAVDSTGLINTASVDSGSVINGSIIGADIRVSAIDSSKVLNGGLTQADLRVSSLDSTRIINSGITGADLRVSIIDSSKVIDGGITTADLRTASVTAAKLASSGVTAGSYTSADITVDIDGRITAAANGSGGSGISIPTARAKTGWTSNGTTATDTLARAYILDKSNLQVHFADADNDSVSFVPQSLYPINYKDGATQIWAVDSTGIMALADGKKQTFNPDATNAGFNLGSQAGNPSSLAVGDMWYNSTTDKAMLYEGSYAVPVTYDPSLMYRLFEDWESGATNTSGAMGVFWQRTIAASGTTTHQAGEAGRPGIMRYFCANSAGSAAALNTDLASYLITTGYEYKTSVRFSSLGTAGSNGAYYRVGFMDGVAATIPSNGIWVEFNVDSSATRFRTITSNGGTRTINTYTGVSVATATWYKIEIIVNSNASSVVFKLDGTTMFTHTTNIPTGNAVGVAAVAAAVTASATKNMEQDYLAVVNKSMNR